MPALDLYKLGDLTLIRFTHVPEKSLLCSQLLRESVNLL